MDLHQGKMAKNMKKICLGVSQNQDRRAQTVSDMRKECTGMDISGESTQQREDLRLKLYRAYYELDQLLVRLQALAQCDALTVEAKSELIGQLGPEIVRINADANQVLRMVLSSRRPKGEN